MDRIHPLNGARLVVRTDGTAITLTLHGTPAPPSPPLPEDEKPADLPPGAEDDAAE